MTILLIGGAGYIGSHMVKRLLAEGERFIVLDNLSTGYRDAILGGEFIQGDCGSSTLLRESFKRHDIGTVMHFASFIQVGESVTEPLKYYLNNVAATLQLLNTMVECRVKNFVFSSSAAVYGDGGNDPIREDRLCAPVSPYGRTKRMIEEALEDLRLAYGINYFALRYFNAAGADPEARIGERHNPETHLIPLVLQAASGRRAAVNVFGQDYPTPDGTCVRDYIHVEDLCEAHLLALQALRRGETGGCFNLGTSSGFSVTEVLDGARRITGRPVLSADKERRPGDPPVLVADSRLFQSRFGWRPQMSSLEPIIETAWRWELELFAKGKHG
jgi:UDP-glucose 4-epimerase